MDRYFGTYQTFETLSKKDAAVLLGADNLVGDIYDIQIEMEGDQHTAWLVNRFNQRIGFFGPDFSRKLSIMRAREMTLTAVLAYVAFTDAPEPGRYWGEMAVFAYSKTEEEAFGSFVDSVAERLSNGIRPKINLGEEACMKIIESKGSWLPEQTIPMPKHDKGTAIMKSKRSMSEKMIEQGRKGNKGCYVVSWAFLLFLVAAAMFGLKACGVF